MNSGSGGVGVSRRYPIGIESWRVDVEYPEDRDRTEARLVGEIEEGEAAAGPACDH